MTTDVGKLAQPVKLSIRKLGNLSLETFLGHEHVNCMRYHLDMHRRGSAWISIDHRRNLLINRWRLGRLAPHKAANSLSKSLDPRKSAGDRLDLDINGTYFTDVIRRFATDETTGESEAERKIIRKVARIEHAKIKETVIEHGRIGQSAYSQISNVRDEQ